MSRTALLVTAVTAVSLPVTPPLLVDAVGREPALELQVGAVEVAEHFVSSVLAVCHPVTPLGGVNTPPVMASSLLLGADSEVLGLAVLLVRAVLTVLVIVTPPSAWDTFSSPAPDSKNNIFFQKQPITNLKYVGSHVDKGSSAQVSGSSSESGQS